MKRYSIQINSSRLLNSVFQRLSRLQMSSSSGSLRVGAAEQNIIWQVEKSAAVPHMWCSYATAYRLAPGHEILCYFITDSLTAKWCLLPGAVVLLLFFFLLRFFTDSGASASSLSSFKSSPLRSWGSTSCCSCTSAMISSWEMKWRISCWEPPVVRAERSAGGSSTNNELLDDLRATTWPE